MEFDFLIRLLQRRVIFPQGRYKAGATAEAFLLLEIHQFSQEPPGLESVT
jgi:hypothetical protein